MINFDDNTVIPALRQDLIYKIIDEDGTKMILLSDPHEIALQPVSVPVDLIPLLQLMNGETSAGEIKHIIEEQIANDSGIIINVFFELVNNFDYIGLLESDRFKQMSDDLNEYLGSDVRNPVCAGSSYSQYPEILKYEIEDIFKKGHKTPSKQNAGAIIVPHIDLRIGDIAHKTYASAYNAISESDAELFIILGTSHYSASNGFMLTCKDFITPFGRIETDRKTITKLKNNLSYNLPFDDKAHKNEHSIELQLIFLQYLFQNHNFKILPILVGSFENHFLNNSLPVFDSRISEFIVQLRKVLEEDGIKHVFIASVDLSHIGKKFGDRFDAVDELPRIKNEDERLLKTLLDLSPDEFFKTIAGTKNSNNVCGLSPIYSLLNIYKAQSAEFLNYEQWYEEETSSAVTFASMAFYGN